MDRAKISVMDIEFLQICDYSGNRSMILFMDERKRACIIFRPFTKYSIVIFVGHRENLVESNCDLTFSKFLRFIDFVEKNIESGWTENVEKN